MINKCPCKFNLVLNVLAKNKKESKHRIESIFVKSKQFCDFMIIKKARTTAIKYINAKIDSKNCLLRKVINYFESKYDLKINLKIKVFKFIPIGSGLGGGSSNAATLIKYLLKKYKIKNLDYLDIALHLGSDIPFFLSDFKIAKVANYGDQVQQYNAIKNIKYKIIPNDINVKTKDIFATFDKQKQKGNIKIKLIRQIFKDKSNTNNLMPSAFIEYPDLKKVYENLTNNRHQVIMSGSGSSFVIIRNIEWS